MNSSYSLLPYNISLLKFHFNQPYKICRFVPVHMGVFLCVYACLCVRQRDRDRDTERQREISMEFT